MKRHSTSKSTIDIAIDAAIELIDLRPGEFRVSDVELQIKKALGILIDPERVIAKPYKDHGYGILIERALTLTVSGRMRRARDKYGWRKYICYTVPGQEERQWLKLDSLVLSTLTAVLEDRDHLRNQIQSFRPVLEAAQRRLEDMSGTTTFGDVKARVYEDLHE